MQAEVLVKNEKVDYGYNPAFYSKGVELQIQILTDTINSFSSRLNPDSNRYLNPSEVLDYFYSGKIKYDLPYGVHEHDGLFAVISPFGFKKLLGYGNPDVFNPYLYCQSLDFLFKKIGEDFTFINYKSDLLNPNYLIQTKNALDGYAKLSYFQPDKSDFWIINAQLGAMRKNQPANIELYPNEYGLSSVFAGCIQLTHPELFSDQWSYLGGLCTGDEFLVNKTVPTLFSNGSVLMYGSHSVENNYPNFGPMTFFI